ncbi:MAG TPA: amidohydrolase family protein, partial [Victivallales bacterium]|nr:amidohydrolase family protein [Victivallales bacterium]
MNREFVVKNACLVNGSGLEPFHSDLYVKDGVILRISQNITLPVSKSVKIYDADGMILAPGFIDTHGHSDVSIIAAPEAEGKISQGVTTEICGNCGLSVFPISRYNKEHLNEMYRKYNLSLDWTDIVGYESRLNAVNPAINIASLCGHNTLQASVCGYDKKEISDDEIAEMKKILHKELKNGAIGFSTGLLYVPGIFSSSREILELLGVSAKFAKVYATHLRSEGDMILEAITEAIG